MKRVESLMPKGVEHEGIERDAFLAHGVESLMPKGVEHKRYIMRLQRTF